jgi:hypothetical protein
LDDGFRGNGAAASAAFFIKEVHDFAQSVGIGRIPEKGALASNLDEADLFQFFQVMRKGGSRNGEFFLNFAGNHTFGMSGEEQAENLEARLRAESREAVGGAGDEEGIGLAHISMIAEIQKNVNFFLAETLSRSSAS